MDVDELRVVLIRPTSRGEPGMALGCLPRARPGDDPGVMSLIPPLVRRVLVAALVLSLLGAIVEAPAASAAGKAEREQPAKKKQDKKKPKKKKRKKKRRKDKPAAATPRAYGLSAKGTYTSNLSNSSITTRS